jgi:hypothetical protein
MPPQSHGDRTRRRSRLAALLLAGIAVALGLAEIALRSTWLPVPPRLGAALHSCYEPRFPDRVIWATLPQFRIALHRPSFTSHCYANGYHWTHTSDASGFRNPETWERADVVLLGDSMVYGHGLEERETLAHFLREETGLAVANQAITGGCPVHYLVYFNNFTLPLKPRTVVVGFHPNDLADIRTLRTPREIAMFAESADDSDRAVLPRDELLDSLIFPVDDTGVIDRLALVRAWSVPWRSERHDQPAPRAGRRAPPDDAAIAERMHEWRDEIGYLRRALRLMSEAARERGIEIILTVVPGSTWDLSAVVIQRTVQGAAEELGLRYLETNHLWRDDAGQPVSPDDPRYYRELMRNGYKLRGDGHPSAKMNSVLAAELARLFERQPGNPRQNGPAR